MKNYLMIYSAIEIKNICKEIGIAPKKSKGQNFLIDGNILKKVISSANLTKKDTVLEIGPGLGVLTCELIKHAGKVIAVELDKKLADFLRERILLNSIVSKSAEIQCSHAAPLKGANTIIAQTVIPKEAEIQCADKAPLKDANALGEPAAPFKGAETGTAEIFTLIQGDALKMWIPLPEKYKIVSNLPYTIGTAVLKKFFSIENKPEETVVFLQKEVAERICAKPPNMSVVALSVQVYGEAEVLFDVSQNCFWPVPDAGSAVLKITKREKPLLESKKHEELFFRIIKTGFSSKRKQLRNNFKNGLKLHEKQILSAFQKIGVSSSVRAEELSVLNWLSLSTLFMD